MYKLIDINSKFIMILQEKASNYIKYIEPVSIYSLPIQIDDIEGEVPVIYPEENKNYINAFQMELRTTYTTRRTGS